MIPTSLSPGSSVPSGNAAPPPNTQVFASTGNWTKPVAPTGCAAYTRYRARIWGGAGGAGSGRKGAASSARCGGGPGQGGNFIEVEGPLSDLADTVAVTVGAGGVGGVSQTTNSNNGLIGTNGGDSSFGVFKATGGFGGAPGNATGALSGANAVFAPGTFPIGYRGNTGNASLTTGAASGLVPATPYAGLAGGPGGGVTTGNVAFNGGVGELGVVGTSTAAGGVVDGAAPVNGTSLPGSAIAAGAGGSGGAGSLTTNAQPGNNGSGIAAGGGGGGGSTDSVGNSGPGGNGSAGYVEVVVF